ncbi:MAG: flippase [Steroidobacteraceae bacterium]
MAVARYGETAASCFPWPRSRAAANTYPGTGFPGRELAVTTFRKLGAHSATYAATTLLQKAATFLLMPVYTLYLDPTAFGTLAIVTAVNGFLSIVFTLGLTGAVARFYFEYREDHTALAEFWGSIFVFVILLSLLMGAVLLLIGPWVLRPFIGDVPFWPFMALGIITTCFQPLFTTFLTLLQTRNQAIQYSVVSIANFLLTTVLTIVLVVLKQWGATGALTATLVSSAIFFAISMYLLRSDVRLCLRWRYLREAFAYSLPQVPHSVASQATAMADRLILNSRLGTAAAGLYSVGAMIAMVVEVAAYSVNRAYFPVSMSAMKSMDPVQLGRMRVLGSLVVAGFCLLGAAVAAFGPELVHLLTTPAFSGATQVIPVLVFGGVSSALYYLLVNVLFFDRHAVKLLPVCTLTGATLNVTLALLLIPRFNLMGAAVANLLAQAFATVLVGVIGRRFDPVQWDYGRYGMAIAVSFAVTLSLSRLVGVGWTVLALAKVSCLLILAILLGTILWRRPLILADAVVQLLQRRPDRAAALFMPARAST